MTASSGLSVPVTICSLSCLFRGLVLWMDGEREVGWISREEPGGEMSVGRRWNKL